MAERERGTVSDETLGQSGERTSTPMTALPPEFLSTIREVAPEVIGGLLREHPERAAPILAAVHQFRGNSVAQAAVAAAASAPLRKRDPEDSQPAPTAGKYTSPAAPVVEPRTAVDAEHAKHIERGKVAAWNQLAAGTPDERSVPTDVRLPPNVVQALDKAWQDTLATSEAQEQGGNLVKHYGGGYGIRRSESQSSHMFEGDDNDLGRFDTLVAQVHTHPYRDESNKTPEEFGTFSDGDFNSLMRSDAHMSVLRSGPYTFILGKTKQFNQLVDPLNNDETKLKQLAARMTKTYEAAMLGTEGMFSEKLEAGVLAVCDAFHLVYYSGVGGELTRRSKKK